MKDEWYIVVGAVVGGGGVSWGGIGSVGRRGLMCRDRREEFEFEVGVERMWGLGVNIRVVRVAGVLGLCDCVIGYGFI